MIVVTTYEFDNCTGSSSAMTLKKAQLHQCVAGYKFVLGNFQLSSARRTRGVGKMTIVFISFIFPFLL
jgi:hypothetical protein